MLPVLGPVFPVLREGVQLVTEQVLSFRTRLRPGKGLKLPAIFYSAKAFLLLKVKIYNEKRQLSKGLNNWRLMNELNPE